MLKYIKAITMAIKQNRRLIPLAAAEKVMRKGGAGRVSEGAKEELSEFLEERALEITKRAIELSIHAKRKTITKEDIRLAVR